MVSECLISAFSDVIKHVIMDLSFDSNLCWKNLLNTEEGACLLGGSFVMIFIWHSVSYLVFC